MRITRVEECAPATRSGGTEWPIELMRAPALAFTAYFAYSPTASDADSRHARRVCAAVKTGNRHWLERAVAPLREAAAGVDGWAESLRRGALLVPIPSSLPGLAVDHVAGAIARVLLRAGLGVGVHPLLERRRRVRKSATSAAGARPSVRDHYDSIEFANGMTIAATTDLLLVDDVVTRGRTMFAAACRLRTAYPGARIEGFALMRTIGFGGEPIASVDPCRGEIRLKRRDTLRIP